MNAICSLPVSGILITIACYAAGLWVKKRVRTPFANPLVVANALVIILIAATPLTAEQYLAGGSLVSLFIGPVTVILALRVYRERALLARNIIPVAGGYYHGHCYRRLRSVLYQTVPA